MPEKCYNAPMHDRLISPGYREYAPPPDLAPWVACFWTQRAEQTVSTPNFCVPPDGCVDVLFESSPQREGLFVVGTQTRPIAVADAHEGVHIGVRFHPGAALPLLKLPVRELTDRIIPLDDLVFPLRLGIRYDVQWYSLLAALCLLAAAWSQGRRLDKRQGRSSGPRA